MAEHRWQPAGGGGRSALARGRLAPIVGVLTVVVVVALLARPAADEGPEGPDGTEQVERPGSLEVEPEDAASPPEDERTPESREPPDAAPALSPFDPSSRWQPLARAPLARSPLALEPPGPPAWDGRRLVLWPGVGNGAAYAPDVDAWASLAPSPIARSSGWSATATEAAVLYWGGRDLEGMPTADGAILDTVTFRWSAIPPAPIAPRTEHGAVWGGGRLWVVGGIDAGGTPLADGAAFDPGTGEWMVLPAAPIAGRSRPTLAWFDPDDVGGRSPELLVWGGLDGAEGERGGASLVDGSRFRSGAGDLAAAAADAAVDDDALDDDPGAWAAMAPLPVPLRGLAATAWTGTERCPESGACGTLHVWGRPIALSERDGWAYDAFRDQWEPHPLLLNQTRSDAQGLWTGAVMIAFGGRDEFDRAQRSDGFLFDANSGRWAQLPAVPQQAGPAPAVVWSGDELIVWAHGRGWRLRVDTGALRD